MDETGTFFAASIRFQALRVTGDSNGEDYLSSRTASKTVPRLRALERNAERESSG
jgi:hypothetical protein